LGSTQHDNGISPGITSFKVWVKCAVQSETARREFRFQPLTASI
jgi:hypothetical protein